MSKKMMPSEFSMPAVSGVSAFQRLRQYKKSKESTNGTPSALGVEPQQPSINIAERLDELAKELTALKTKLSNSETEKKESDAKLAAQEQDLKKLKEEKEKLDAKKLEEQKKELDAKLLTQEQDLEKLKQTIDQNAKAIININTNAATVKQVQQSLADDLKQTNHKVTDLITFTEGKVSEIKEKASSMEQTIDFNYENQQEMISSLLVQIMKGEFEQNATQANVSELTESFKEILNTEIQELSKEIFAKTFITLLKSMIIAEKMGLDSVQARLTKLALISIHKIDIEEVEILLAEDKSADAIANMIEGLLGQDNSTADNTYVNDEDFLTSDPTSDHDVLPLGLDS